MRLRSLLLTTIPLLALLVACGDDDRPDGTSGENEPITSATPYVVMPTAVIVQGTQGPAGGSRPSGSTQETTYTVESGDTLLALATRYDTTVEAIMTRNDIVSASDLQVGQELIIPKGASSAATPPAQPTATRTAPSAATATPPTSTTATPTSGTATPADGETYEVQSGDLAGSIAAQFGITLAELAEANNRTVESLDQIVEGDELIIPGQ